ncbi:hypothetical protein FNF31_03224 [Cafeteria roenbergensis]|uniref:Splicing factor YJU2 n=1 Tax=Cafeteria roenbergensis TaxID=33653 RepID=A0A5A8DY41_CAFRO|nr:hypothetical protein FNF31_03224 [Cafeteria roenbergensis]KAA0170443.1 hypothetical protein FNF28_01437 [Cafeteria roenbergensis]
MSERKVQNKYFPPEYDYRRTPKAKRKSGPEQWKIRNMLPFTVRCLTCGEFMFAGTKFNTPQERAGDYLGVPIYRFYYRCPKCSAEFTLCTDPENESYVVEAGVTRPFGGSDPIRTFRQTAHAAAEEMETEAAAGAAGDGAGAPRASKAEAMAAVESRAAEMRKQAEADDEVEALYERRRQEAVLGPDAMIAMVQRGEALMMTHAREALGPR